MLSKPSHICFSLLIGLCLLASVALDNVFAGHPPYVDPHFDLHHTPKYDSGTRSMYSDYGYHSASGTHLASTCSACIGSTDNFGASNNLGSRSPSCPPVQNAILKLWVPDGCPVEINGQQTKLQTLGGIHKNSRIFSLEGLESARISPCDIVIITCDNMGFPVRHHRALAVTAGEHYDVRFPDGFAPISNPSVILLYETPQPGVSVESSETFSPTFSNPSLREGELLRSEL